MTQIEVSYVGFSRLTGLRSDDAKNDMGSTYSIELGPHKIFGHPTIFTTAAGSHLKLSRKSAEKTWTSLLSSLFIMENVNFLCILKNYRSPRKFQGT